MKQNRIFLIIALVLTICFFSGCKKNNIEACEHNFSDATCTSPSTCTKCGETRGTALGHDWLDATYESPKTCQRCGATEGDPVGEHTHIFKKATCTKPKICRICSFEEGSPLGHEESIKFPEDAKCNNTYTVEVYCTRCEELLYEDEMVKEHDLYEEIVVPVTCTTYGSSFTKCHNCDYESENILKPTGHSIVYIIDKEPTSTECGYRHRECENCDYCESKMAYVNNGFSTHGKLQVVGPDLVDQYGVKFQLIGLSTHGLQWFGRYVNYETFESLRNGFGINVIRLSLYTSEGGYCVTTPSKKAALFDLVCKGIEYATQLDMYVIVDWHMLGAEDERDENPLFYKEEAVEFFSKITEKYKDYENILFDIKNVSYATYILELSTQVAKQNSDSEIFTLLISSLKKINEGLDPKIITLIHEVQCLKYLGIDIMVDACTNCGSTNDIVTLNSEKGGYICKECYENEKIVDEKTLKVIRLFYHVDISKISKLELSNITIKEISDFLEEYYDRYSGLYLKSKSLLNMII